MANIELQQKNPFLDQEKQSSSHKSLPEPTKNEDNPRKAVCFFILGGFFFCVSFTCGKVLFTRHPDYMPTQLLCCRALLQMLILSILLNKKLKYVMIDSVNKSSVTGLATRVLTGCFLVFVNYYIIKIFNLTLLAMVINTSPLLTVILAALILKEKINYLSIVYLLLGFTAVAIMIFGSSKHSDNESESIDDIEASTTTTTSVTTVGFGAYLVLLLNPVAQSAGQLAMRSMKSLPQLVVSCWISAVMIMLYVPTVYFIQGSSLNILTQFNVGDWLILVVLAVTSLFEQTFNFMAFKHWTASRLQPYSFVQPLQQFIVDSAFFGATFSPMQIFGLFLLIGVYGFQLVMSFVNTGTFQKQET